MTKHGTFFPSANLELTLLLPPIQPRILDSIYRHRSRRVTDNSLRCRENPKKAAPTWASIQNLELNVRFFRFVR
jgi:hypothetical protein